MPWKFLRREARRAQLSTPAWVIVDEFNTDDIKTSLAIASCQPLGVFSRAFMTRIAAAAATAIRACANSVGSTPLSASSQISAFARIGLLPLAREHMIMRRIGLPRGSPLIQVGLLGAVKE